MQLHHELASSHQLSHVLEPDQLHLDPGLTARLKTAGLKRPTSKNFSQAETFESYYQDLWGRLGRDAPRRRAQCRGMSACTLASTWRWKRWIFSMLK
jgi:hypothetical protein